jgi:ankyrin repeat protein
MDMLKFSAILGLDVNQIDGDGFTALHEACMTAKDIELLKWLVSIGASTEVLTFFEETPYDLAIENEQLIEEDLQFLKSSP